MRPSRPLMIATLLGSSLIGGAVGLWAAGPRPGNRPPRGLVVLGPPRVEAGQWDRARPFEHTFLLRNTADAPIRIHRVRTRCTCTSADASGQSVGPGRTTTVTVAVRTFDPDLDRFDEPATIETDAGPVEVRLSGDLPPSGKVFARPSILYLEANAGRPAAGPAREVRLRVPSRCSREITGSDVAVVWLSGLEVEVTGRHRDGLYDEYTLGLTFSGAEEKDQEGILRVATGCETVTIPIVVHAVGGR
jgi:hypothetical protein